MRRKILYLKYNTREAMNEWTDGEMDGYVGLKT